MSSAEAAPGEDGFLSRTISGAHSHLTVLVALLLVATGFSIRSSLTVVALWATLSMISRWVISPFSIKCASQLVGFLSGPLLIGGTVTLVIVIFGGIFQNSALLGVGGLVIVFFFLAKRSEQRVCINQSELPIVYGIVAICSLGLANKQWYFLFPFAVLVLVSLAGLLILIRKRHLPLPNRFMPFFLIPPFLGALWSRILSIDNQSEGLIFRSADQYYRSSLGFSTTRFGLSDHVGAVGYGLSYHWLSEAMMGMLSLVSGQSALDVVVRVSAPLAVLSAGFAAFHLCRVLGLDSAQGLFSVGLLTLLSNFLYSLGLNILKTTEMGQLWGTSFFLFGFSLLVIYFSEPTLRNGFMLAWVSVLTMMTNSTLGLVLIGAAMLVIGQHLLTRTNRRNSLLAAILVLGSVTLLTQTLLKSTEKGDFSPRFSWIEPFGYSYVFGYIGNNQLVKLAGAVALVLLMWFQGGAFLPRFARLRANWFSSPLVTVAYAFVVALGGATFIQIGNFEQYRFLLTFLILTPVLAAKNLDMKLFRGSRLVWIAPTLLTAMVLGWLSRDYLQKAFGDATFFRPRLVYVFFLVMTPLVIWAGLTLIGRLRGMHVTPALRTVVLVFAVVASISHTTRETYAYIDYSSQLVSPSAANAGRYECLEFVKNESDVDDRIATTMWRWSSEFFSEKWYIASAVSERMTYVDGPLYVQNPRPNWLQERADRTLRFAENPNIADLRELQSWGVTWFVADRNWSTTSDWTTVGSVAMANESCVVIKLRTT